MTFATKVKSEISHNKGLIGRNKKAFSYGMMLCGKSFSQQSISMTTENKYIAKLYAKLIFQQIPMQTSVTTREYNGNFQQPTYAVSVDDEEDRKTLLAFFQGQEGGYDFALLEDVEHRHAFLAGALLSCSNISDPQKDYHLEFVLTDEQTALFLMGVLDSLQLNFKRTTRRGQQIVYCKDSASIEEILTMVGATGSMMDVVNVKIYKDMRNKVNRVTNCETSNIEKTVSAATVQAADIRYLQQRGLFDTMEVPLQADSTGQAGKSRYVAAGAGRAAGRFPLRYQPPPTKDQPAGKAGEGRGNLRRSSEKVKGGMQEWKISLFIFMSTVNTACSTARAGSSSWCSGQRSWDRRR